MTFTLHMAADLHGRHIRFSLSFAECPSIVDLVKATEKHIKEQEKESAKYYHIQTFQVFDDILQKWVDVYDSSQLSNECHVFVLQPESFWVPLHSKKESIAQEDDGAEQCKSTIPAPYRRQPSEHEIPSGTLYKIRSVFLKLSTEHQGEYIVWKDLSKALDDVNHPFDTLDVGDVHGHIPYNEWVAFAMERPDILDALFYQGVGHKHKTEGEETPKPSEDVKAARKEDLHQMHNKMSETREHHEKSHSEARSRVEEAKKAYDLTMSAEQEAHTHLTTMNLLVYTHFRKQ
jgi:hypothetical protein